MYKMILFFLPSFLPILFFSLVSCYANIQTRVLRTPIHQYFPFLKLHHIVLFSNPNVERSVYAVDFSPVNQTAITTLHSLFLGKSVPAELRLRHLHNSTIYDDEKILKNMQFDISYEKSKHLSESVYTSMRDKRMKQIITKLKTWNEYKMNMYTRNCQHFSAFALKKSREKPGPWQGL
jgi:hypothetical protein